MLLEASLAITEVERRAPAGISRDDVGGPISIQIGGDHSPQVGAQRVARLQPALAGVQVDRPPVLPRRRDVGEAVAVEVGDRHPGRRIGPRRAHVHGGLEEQRVVAAPPAQRTADVQRAGEQVVGPVLVEVGDRHRDGGVHRRVQRDGRHVVADVCEDHVPRRPAPDQELGVAPAVEVPRGDGGDPAGQLRREDEVALPVTAVEAALLQSAREDEVQVGAAQDLREGDVADLPRR